MRVLFLLALFIVPAFAQTASQPLDARNAALLALKREQAALWQAEIDGAGRFTPYGWNDALRRARARAEQVRQTEGDAAAIPFHSFQERAYFARNDGSPQPYYVALPTDYTPTKKYPLVVFLHGYSPDISKINPPVASPDTVRGAQRRGFILAMPYGRRNSDFVQWGQDDVLRVREECLKLFSVDEDRVFLLGVSMGGYGAYATGLHSIDKWAAIAAISGRSDFYLWFDLRRNKLPAWKRILFDADDPRTLELNARNTPILVQHGALDGVVPVEHSRLIADDARKLGLPLRYIEDKYGSHFGDFHYEATERALDWFEQRGPIPPPRALTVVAGDLREASGRWASIEAFQDYTQIARLDAHAMADKIVVKTRNVASFRLELPPEIRPNSATVPLEVDGEVVGQFETDKPIIWSAPAAKLGKSPTRTGPFKSLMRDAFLLVYGDDNDARAARTFATRWQIFADGKARLKSAADISPADKANFNLILFGTRATNPLIAQIANDLPLELTPTGYRIGTKTVEARDIGLRMVWKSPWEEARLIGVCSGETWGTGLPPNHVWDLIPDYIIYDYRSEADGTNRPLEAGFFDGDWELTSIFRQDKQDVQDGTG